MQRQQQQQQQQTQQQQTQQQPQTLITLYYKTNCEHSKRILNSLIPHQVLIKNVNFISLDNFFKNKEGQLCVQLQNGSVVMIPSQINRVPALFIYKREQQQQQQQAQPPAWSGVTQQPQFIFGDEILQYFAGYIQHMKNLATNNNGQVAEFSGFEKAGVVSDAYGFLDDDLYGDLQNTQNGQLHSYADANSVMSDNNIGLLGKPLQDLKQQFNPSEFMSRDQMSQGTQYNQNQFRVQQQFQDPKQFPKGAFFEGQMQQQPMQQQNANTSYNQNEFFPQQQQPQQGQLPDRLRSMETKKEGFEEDMKKQMDKIQSERGYNGGGMQQQPQMTNQYGF